MNGDKNDKKVIKALNISLKLGDIVQYKGKDCMIVLCPHLERPFVLINCHNWVSVEGFQSLELIEENKDIEFKIK